MLIYFAWSNLSNVEARKDREMIYFYPVCMIRFLLFRCMFYINWGKNMSMHVNTLGYFIITIFMSVQTIINPIALCIEISLVFLFVSWTLFPQFVNLIYFQDQKLFFFVEKKIAQLQLLLTLGWCMCFWSGLFTLICEENEPVTYVGKSLRVEWNDDIEIYKCPTKRQ